MSGISTMTLKREGVMAKLFLIALVLGCFAAPAFAETRFIPGQTTTITPDGNGGYQVYTPPQIIYEPPPAVRNNWDYTTHPNGPFAPAQIPFQNWGR